MVPGYGASVGRGFFPTAGRTLAAAGIACVRMNYAGSGIGSDLTTFNDEVAACSHTYLDELADLDALITQARHLADPCRTPAWIPRAAAHSATAVAAR